MADEKDNLGLNLSFLKPKKQNKSSPLTDPNSFLIIACQELDSYSSNPILFRVWLGFFSFDGSGNGMKKAELRSLRYFKKPPNSFDPCDRKCSRQLKGENPLFKIKVINYRESREFNIECQMLFRTCAKSRWILCRIDDAEF